ncbi:MAG: hypothetical protein ACPHER_05125, partial [Nevskiales bacterium]
MPLLSELLNYMSALLAEFNGQIVLSVVSFGMGVAFYSADPRSPTSKYIALFFLGVGLSISMNTSCLSKYVIPNNRFVNRYSKSCKSR